MSMLSAQIDELRKAAEYYDDSEVASIMRYAADTIWQLRDGLQRTNTENAALRTQLADVTESMGRVEERCAKLRELLRAAYNCINAGPSCLECRVVAGGCTLLSAMRELGVEV